MPQLPTQIMATATGLKPNDIITDRKGTQYKVIEKLGEGSQASVWKVKEQGKPFGKEYAAKYYKPNDCPKGVQNNITFMVENPIVDNNGNRLENVITPNAVVDYPDGGFGYIMDLVDTKSFIQILDSFNSAALRPNLRAICKIAKNLGNFYKAVHLQGFAYKDLSEANVRFDPRTGEIVVMDMDNTGPAETKTVLGTGRFIAPELRSKEMDAPDFRSDDFAFAVYLYRLLIGGFPLEGSGIEPYLDEHDCCFEDVMHILLGSKALYVWHSTDHSNTIEGQKSDIWDIQAKRYHALHPRIRELFTRCFETGLKNRAERPQPEEWLKAFDEIEKDLVQCDHKKHTGTRFRFGKAERCYACLTETKVGAPAATLTVRILSAGLPEKKITVTHRSVFKGSDVSPLLPPGNLFSAIYSPNDRAFIIMNLSSLTWTLHDLDQQGKVIKSVPAPPKQQMYLRENRIVSFIPQKVNLRFYRIDY